MVSVAYKQDRSLSNFLIFLWELPRKTSKELNKITFCIQREVSGPACSSSGPMSSNSHPPTGTRLLDFMHLTLPQKIAF